MPRKPCPHFCRAIGKVLSAHLKLNHWHSVVLPTLAHSQRSTHEPRLLGQLMVSNLPRLTLGICGVSGFGTSFRGGADFPIATAAHAIRADRSWVTAPDAILVWSD